MKRRNPVIFGQQVNPWLLGGLGAAVLLFIATKGETVAEMVKDVFDNKKRTDFIRKLAKERGIPEAVALAIFKIESGGKGFSKDGKMVIRFEGHKFKEYSGGKTVAVVHAGQKSEWDNFNRATAIDPQAAMMAISMGGAQIMGFNHKLVGFPTVEAMFNAYSTSEEAQIRGFFDFVKNTGLEKAAKSGDFLTFARGYNGKGQKGYDVKMKKLYDELVKQGYAGIA
jgi:hypothetical protein